MSNTTDGVIPYGFLQMLRQIAPQFAERSRGAKPANGILEMGGYAQQGEYYHPSLNRSPVAGASRCPKNSSSASFLVYSCEINYGMLMSDCMFLSLSVDAEECWTAIVNGLKSVKGLPGTQSQNHNFVEQYLTAKMRRECVSLLSSRSMKHGHGIDRNIFPPG